jgi:hypothetical protein
MRGVVSLCPRQPELRLDVDRTDSRNAEHIYVHIWISCGTLFWCCELRLGLYCCSEASVIRFKWVSTTLTIQMYRRSTDPMALHLTSSTETGVTFLSDSNAHLLHCSLLSWLLSHSVSHRRTFVPCCHTDVRAEGGKPTCVRWLKLEC